MSAPVIVVLLLLAGCVHGPFDAPRVPGAPGCTGRARGPDEAVAAEAAMTLGTDHEAFIREFVVANNCYWR